MIEEIYEILPDYRYKAEKDGVVENELCPVFIAFTDNKPKINREEVEDVRWMPWRNFIKEVTDHLDDWSPWCIEQTLLLDRSEQFQSLFKQKIKD